MDASGDETLSKIALTLYVLHLWCFALHLVKDPSNGKKNDKRARGRKSMRLDSVPTMTVWSITTKGNMAEKVRVPQHEL